MKDSAKIKLFQKFIDRSNCTETTKQALHEFLREIIVALGIKGVH